MRSLNPYLTFNGQAREAMAYYHDCFGGEIVAQQSFAEAGMPAPAGYENQVMHSELQAPGIRLMMSDGMPGWPAANGTQITLCLQLDDTAEQDRLFQSLSAGGSVLHPLENTFWGARFGQVTDRFGIQWMLNCMLN